MTERRKRHKEANRDAQLAQRTSSEPRKSNLRNQSQKALSGQSTQNDNRLMIRGK